MRNARAKNTEKHEHTAGVDLGFIKGGGLTQGINLLGPSMLELGGPGGMPPPGKV